MAAEVKKFRELLGDWLEKDVTALGAQVGDRIYPVWPPEVVTYPCCAFNIRTRTGNEYGIPQWSGSLEIYLFDTSEDTLDDLEDAIVDYAVQNAEDMLGKLTDAATVLTRNFIFQGAEQDPKDAFMVDDFMVIVRVLSFDFLFVKRVGAWAT